MQSARWFLVSQCEKKGIKKKPVTSCTLKKWGTALPGAYEGLKVDAEKSQKQKGWANLVKCRCKCKVQHQRLKAGQKLKSRKINLNTQEKECKRSKAEIQEKQTKNGSEALLQRMREAVQE